MHTTNLGSLEKSQKMTMLEHTTIVDLTHSSLHDPSQSDLQFIPISINNNQSINTHDIILFDPKILESFEHGNIPIPDAQKFLKHFELKKNNIADILSRRKIVVVFLKPTKRGSGWKAHGLAEDYIWNYALLPDDLKEFLLKRIIPQASGGPVRKICECKSNHPLNVFNKTYQGKIHYTAYLDLENLSSDESMHWQPLLQDDLDRKVTIAAIYTSNTNGKIVFLPEPFYFENKKSLFISSVIRPCIDLLKDNTKTTCPSWCDDFILPGQDRIKKNIFDVETKIENLSQQRNNLKHELEKLTQYHALLYEKNNMLTEIAIKSFELFGLNAKPFPGNSSERDIIIETDSVCIVVEVTGSSTHIKNEKWNQLLQKTMHEKGLRDPDETGTYKKKVFGILLGNGFNDQHPSKRTSQFTDAVISSSKQNNLIKLLTSYELFQGVIRVLETNNEVTKEQICERIINPTDIYITLT